MRAARVETAGALRHEVVEAERVHLRERFARRAFAHRHHGDDGGDAEHDAEHAQGRAQAIAAERLGRDAQVLRRAQRG